MSTTPGVAYDPGELVSYKRSRFQTRLPKGRLYTASHFWLMEREPGLWRVGFTRFATRMLGEIVEHGFEVKPDDAVKVGQTIGWVEGFKAMTDLYCVLDGVFAGGNPLLDLAGWECDLAILPCDIAVGANQDRHVVDEILGTFVKPDDEVDVVLSRKRSEVFRRRTRN